MEYALNSKQTKSIESFSINSFNESLKFMKQAGYAVYEEIVKSIKPCKTLVICGPGNNGGDGYVAAQFLLEDYWDVTILQIESIKTKETLHYSQKFKGKIVHDASISIENIELVIDAIYGIGFCDKPLSEKITNFIKKTYTKRCISIDIATGINASSGKIINHCFKPDLTITFNTKKLGHLLMPGLAHSGKVIVKDIGLNNITESENYVKINTTDLWSQYIKCPTFYDNKYTRGCVGIISGEMLGAAILASQSARKSGCGIVKLFTNKKIDFTLDPGIVVVNYQTLNELKCLIKQHKITSILYGPGTIKCNEKLIEILIDLNVGMVLDAGGIPSIKFLKTYNVKNILLTPHQGEFEKIFGKNDSNKIDTISLAIKKSGCSILFKGPDTVIGDTKNNLAIQDNPCPYLSTAGTGDVLAGICSSFMSQGISGFISAAISSWITSEIAWQIGYGMIAEDIPPKIPRILGSIINNRLI